MVEGQASPFASLSKAASAVTGTASNGWTLWRTADGRTLDVLRQQFVEEYASSAPHPRPVADPARPPWSVAATSAAAAAVGDWSTDLTLRG
ncbi:MULTISPECIES: DUF4357 domain-containing protein [Streptomyces]|uniref:DUF4357 domain-containing protein n=1 Tax=Streptomyces TaxID=1883 RepID=UPI001CF1F4BD